MARDLYIGDHWRAACTAYAHTLKYSSRAELWVVSAGYGLVRSTRALKAYGATFASGSADSVWRGGTDGDRRTELAAWWAALDHESSVADLLGRDTVVVIAAGVPYVEALDVEIRSALDRDVSAERLSIISAGSPPNAASLPVSGRFRRAFGGTDAALNARVLATLAADAPEHHFRRSAMSAVLTGITAHTIATERTSGKRAEDGEIVHRIKGMRRMNPSLSRTQALRELRRSGMACEQRRFGYLWAETLKAKP